MIIDVIQIGSHVGKGDRVFADVQRGRLQSGILLEPIPALFSELQANYTPFGRGFHCVNAALHATRKQAELEYVADITGLPEWSCAIGSMVPSVKRKHIDIIEAECGRTPQFVKITVPCISFDDLLRDYDVEQVNELHIDTEGMDKEILASFPFDRFRPRKVVFEFAHLQQDEVHEAISLLLGHGYRLRQDDIDYIAELG
jgi:FkbM family methyltransferase